MKFLIDENRFSLVYNGKTILEHSFEKPMIYVGYGEEHLDMYRGNFDIKDYIVERNALRNAKIERADSTFHISFLNELELIISVKNDLAVMNFVVLNPAINRFWFRVEADKEEKCYGCGEQMSYFNLRGRSFPLWTSEPGVGRDKTSLTTLRYNLESKGGGDYYNTNYPQPTYVSTKKYYLHIDSTAYCDFNFEHEEFHELQVWEVPKEIRIEAAPTYLELVEKISEFFGRQPELPDWIYQGAILGVQGGTERSFQLVDRSLRNGIKVAGVWCQDWEGKLETSFGLRLRWHWQWNKEMYPNLPEKIKEYKEKGIRFLGYINPYLLQGTPLYEEGKAKGYFATKEDGSEYVVDFGEFYCGVVDLTNPDAYEWYKNNIKRDLIAFGLDGWMADFGEYLPTDLKLSNGVSPMLEHNKWPVRWAKCNYEALEETGKLGEIVYFMRAGGAGIQKYCPLLWAGDQSVNFSRHDGLVTVIIGALSAGMMGCGLHHSDIGGYTSIYDILRTKELFLRWAEMAAFTPVMRTHEGNRPSTNFQYYDDADTMEEFARLIKVHVELTPYIKALVKENAQKGIPVQRPLFLHYEEDQNTYELQTQYLFGRDMLVAPVYLEGETTREVYLPKDEWIHLWTGENFEGGTVTVEAKIGYPPVFYRKNSEYAALFSGITNKY
ncbi:MAG: alpha-glucosidase [Mobilitalea sp.]